MNVEAIFAEALAKNTVEERTAYLDEVCGQDAALRTRVETLLRSHESAGSFLGKPAIQCAAEAIAGKAGGNTTEAEHPPEETGDKALGIVLAAMAYGIYHDTYATDQVVRQAVAAIAPESEA